MAAPFFVDSNTQDAASALNLTFSIPGGATTGDFMIAFVKQSENTSQREWDDDGGGGNGWTREVYNRTTSGRDQETAIYWKIHTGSESNPTFTWATGITAEPMSGSLLVYRDVDQASPFTEVTFAQAPNDANPPNPTVRIDNANSRVICFHAATHDDISSPAPPTGFVMRSQVWSGTANDHRNHFTADIEIDTLGDYTPPDWQHSVLNTTPEYHTYSIALNEVQPIGVTSGTGIEPFSYGAMDLLLNGFGFEAVQGTGKVELWSDMAGTIKTVQTIDSWSDTVIQFDSAQGSLPNDTILYLVVTNDNGDVSSPKPVAIGVLPYEMLIVDELRCDHYWRFNGNLDDTGDTGPVRDFDQLPVGAPATEATPIVDGNTHALRAENVLDRRRTTDSPNMNITITSNERTLSMWIQLGGIQHSLGAIWKEGGGVQNLAFLIGYGNVVLAQGADTPGNAINAQAWSDFKLAAGRPYNIVLRYSLDEDPRELRLYVDGVEQTDTDGNPLGTGSFNSHSGDNVLFDPDANLETGGTDIAYAGQENILVSDFATWSDNSGGVDGGALDKTSAIRDILFRRGAVPDDTIATDTEANMQTALDATLDVRRDWPLSYRIEPVTGAGDLELVLNDKVFDDRVTLHLEWRGGSMLTLVRPSGSNFDLSKAWSPTGGSLQVVDIVDVVVTAVDIDDSTPIENARVRVTAAAGGTTAQGTPILEGLTNSSGVLEGTFRYDSDQPVEGRVRQGTTAPFYKTAGIAGTITSAGLALTVFMIKDQ